jgi:hypothetical protein
MLSPCTLFRFLSRTASLEHESAMVDAYTKMKPDSFKSQLQAVLTTHYEDIKGVQGDSGCHKTRIVKLRFEGQEDDAGNEGADAADAGAGAGAVDAGAGVADASAGAAGAAGGGEAPAAPAPAPRAPALSGRRGHGLLRRRLLRLMLNN